MFQIATGRHTTNYDQKCYNWFAKEMRRFLVIRYLLSQTLICPCESRLADVDGRWKFDSAQYHANVSRRCYYEETPWGVSTQVTCIVLCNAVVLVDLVVLIGSNDIQYRLYSTVVVVVVFV